MDFNKILEEAVKVLNKESQEKESAREFSYRGGSTGAKLGPKEFIGHCPRRALARALGHFDDTDTQGSLMMSAGVVSEDRWDTYFEAAGVNVIKADDYVRWETEAGTPVTGSPDGILLADDNKTPLWGIEHKRVSSVWTAFSVVNKGVPKMDHTVQAAHYSLALNQLPYSILYTADTNFGGPEWISRSLPKPFEAGSEDYAYTYYRYTGKKTPRGNKSKSKINLKPEDKDLLPAEIWAKYKPDLAEFKNTRPFARQFDLSWDTNNNLLVDGKKTIITASSIVEFYDELDVIQRDKTLPARPLSMDIYGNPEKFSPCTYCPLEVTCDVKEKDYEAWEQAVKQTT